MVDPLVEPDRLGRTPPRDRPCKYDGQPVTYDRREDVWVGGRFHQYGKHDGPCGRRLVLLRVTPPEVMPHRCEWVSSPLSRRPRRCSKPGSPVTVGSRRDGSPIVKMLCAAHGPKAAE